MEFRNIEIWAETDSMRVHPSKTKELTSSAPHVDQRLFLNHRSSLSKELRGCQRSGYWESRQILSSQCQNMSLRYSGTERQASSSSIVPHPFMPCNSLGPTISSIW